MSFFFTFNYTFILYEIMNMLNNFDNYGTFLDKIFANIGIVISKTIFFDVNDYSSIFLDKI